MKRHKFVHTILLLAVVFGTTLAGHFSFAPPHTQAASQTAPSASDFSLAYDPVVAGLINAVQQEDVYYYAGALTGEFPVTIGGQAHTIATRNMYYESQIDAAAQYTYEFMQAQGLSVSFFEYDHPNSGRNVVAVLPGVTHPDEIILVTAHLDNMPEAKDAPGADDNTSGCVGVMITAARLAGHNFERTVRFILFTDEEYEASGSVSYAENSLAQGENIVAVYNMDMIAWDDNNDGRIYLETRLTSNPEYAEDRTIANTFIDVVNTYGLQDDLIPQIDPNSDEYVDSASFWDLGYPSITVIEDFEHFELNPYYHTAQDTLQKLNMAFFTNNVKATVGAIAHLALPIPIIQGANKIYLPLVSR